MSGRLAWAGSTPEQRSDRELSGRRVSAYASDRGRALIDRELYLPKDWTDDREPGGQPGLVSDLGQQGAARMRHHPVSGRRHIYLHPAPIARHLHVILPSWFLDLQQAEESLLRRTVKRPRPPVPTLFHAQSGLTGRGANLRAWTGSVSGVTAVDVEDMARDE